MDRLIKARLDLLPPTISAPHEPLALGPTPRRQLVFRQHLKDGFAAASGAGVAHARCSLPLALLRHEVHVGHPTAAVACVTGSRLPEVKPNDSSG